MSAPALVLIVGITLTNSSFPVDPPPDGGNPNNNTAEGEDALFSLTTAFSNTAIGSNALFANTIGADNTAVGAFALLRNTTGVPSLKDPISQPNRRRAVDMSAAISKNS